MVEKVERYIYAVTRKLPEKQRKDIEQELRSSIEDMLTDRTGEEKPSVADIEAVLNELGDPSLLADGYRMSKKYLIGPQNYDTYFFVLKIVIAAVVFGITLALTIGFIVEPPQSLGDLFGSYMGSTFGAVFQAFAWVTIIFALIERKEVSLDREFVDGEKWSTDKLPALPGKESLIKPAEAIAGLLFAILAVVLFNYADHLIGIYIMNEEGITRITPLFNHVTFRSLLPIVNIMLAVGVFKELLKLAVGRWTVGLAFANLFFNAASFGLFFFFIRSAGLWNENFLAFWAEKGFLPVGSDPLILWNQFIVGLIAVVAFAMLLDSLVNLVKAYKNRVYR
jgi:hypothetical protein